MTRKISDKGEALIKGFEGCEKRRPDGKLDAYPDPASGGDPWTIGWGATGPDIKRGTVWTQIQADEWFDKHIQRYADHVSAMVKTAPTTQGQFDALTSFCYNCGPENLRRSTLMRKHLEGDYAGAQDEFQRWNKAAGRVMRGLTRRRASEAALYAAA